MMNKQPITEAEIVDVLLGDAEPGLEARVHQAMRHDPQIAALHAQWSRVLPPLQEAAAPLKPLNARVRDNVMSRLGEQPLAVHFFLDDDPDSDERGRPGSFTRRWFARRVFFTRRAVAVGVAALLMAGLLGPSSWERLWPSVVAQTVTGQLQIVAPGGGPGTRLRPGDRLRLPVRLQAAAGAEADLLLADRSRLRITGAGEVSIESRRGVRQLAGVASYRVAHRWLGGTFKVEIPQGVVEDLGTEFKVAVGEGGRSVVRVSDGRVRIIPRGGAGVEARAGERAVLASGAASVEPAPAGTDLAQARAHFTTRLTRHGPPPQNAPAPPLPADAREVTFRSGGLNLKAWVSATPEGGRPTADSPKNPAEATKHPAVVFAHPGFALAAGTWEATEPYRRAGFIVIVPMLRGENGNPGNFEAFWGEADDLLAAGEFAAALPDVEPSRVFLAGVGEGGTLAALAALLPSRFAAVAPIDAPLDLGEMLPSGILPFDPNDPGEGQLRSPRDFPESVRCPLHLILGDADAARLAPSQDFAREAAAAGKPCQRWVVQGDAQAGIRESLLIFQDLMTRRGPGEIR